MSNFKAQAHIRELKQRLSIVIPTATFAESMDVDGFVKLETTLVAEKVIVKIVTDGNAGRVNGLGMPQISYSPHICQMLQDTTIASADAKALIAKVTAAVAKLGMKVIIKETAAPAIATFEADFTAGTAVATLASDELNPLTISQ